MIEDEINVSMDITRKINMVYTLMSKITFFMLILCKTLELSSLNEIISFSQINRYLIYSLIVFTALQLTISKFYLTRFLIFSFLVIVFFVGYYSSGNNTLVTELIIVYCLGLSEKIEDYYKIMLNALFLAFIIVVLSLLLGLIQNQIQYRLEEQRYTLGFRLAIYPPGILYVITSLYVFLHKQEQKKLGTILLLLANFIVMILCSGRTYFFQIILIYSVLFFVQVTRKMVSKNVWTKILYIPSISILVLGAFFSIYSALNFNYMNSNWQKLNAVLNNRLLFASSYLKSYDLKIFGQPIVIESSEQTIKTGLGGLTLDNAYLYLLIHFGVVAFIISLFLLMKLLRRLYERNDYVSLLLWLSMIITMISGNNILFLNRNFLILQFSMLMIPRISDVYSNLER